jgi:hypothetical protein
MKNERRSKQDFSTDLKNVYKRYFNQDINNVCEVRQLKSKQEKLQKLIYIITLLFSEEYFCH